MHCPRSGISRIVRAVAQLAGRVATPLEWLNTAAGRQWVLARHSDAQVRILWELGWYWTVHVHEGSKGWPYIGVRVGGTTPSRGPTSCFLDISGTGPEVDLPQLFDGECQECLMGHSTLVALLDGGQCRLILLPRTFSPEPPIMVSGSLAELDVSTSYVISASGTESDNGPSQEGIWSRTLVHSQSK